MHHPIVDRELDRLRPTCSVYWDSLLLNLFHICKLDTGRTSQSYKQECFFFSIREVKPLLIWLDTRKYGVEGFTVNRAFLFKRVVVYFLAGLTEH